MLVVGLNRGETWPSQRVQTALDSRNHPRALNTSASIGKCRIQRQALVDHHQRSGVTSLGEPSHARTEIHRGRLVTRASVAPMSMTIRRKWSRHGPIRPGTQLSSCEQQPPSNLRRGPNSSRHRRGTKLVTAQSVADLHCSIISFCQPQAWILSVRLRSAGLARKYCPSSVESPVMRFHAPPEPRSHLRVRSRQPIEHRRPPSAITPFTASTGALGLVLLPESMFRGPTAMQRSYHHFNGGSMPHVKFPKWRCDLAR